MNNYADLLKRFKDLESRVSKHIKLYNEYDHKHEIASLKNETWSIGSLDKYDRNQVSVCYEYYDGVGMCIESVEINANELYLEENEIIKIIKEGLSKRIGDRDKEIAELEVALEKELESFYLLEAVEGLSKEILSTQKDRVNSVKYKIEAIKIKNNIDNVSLHCQY